MGIDLFDKLFDIAKEDVAEEKAYLKRIRDRDVFSSLSNIDFKLQDLSAKKNELETDIQPIEKELLKFEEHNNKLRLQLKDVATFDNVDFDTQITKSESELEKQKSFVQNEEEYRENLRPLYNQVYIQLKDFDENKIFADYEEFQEVKELKLKKENELKILTSQIESLEIKLVELEKYKYDPDCEYCLKNGENKIPHKTEIMESLNQKGDEILYTKSKYELIEIDYERLSEAENQKQKYDSLSDDLKQIESDAYKTHAKIKEMEKDILNTEGILSNLYDDKQRYEKNKSAIEHNKKMDVEIKSIEGEIQLQISLKNKLIKELDKINSQILINETNKKNLEEEVKDLVEAEQKVNDYELYLRLVSRDGIPQLIINDALPIIESEVNVVLERMMAGFKIGITNEDKNINLYIRYDDQEWPLNLSSGMERFVTSLALRVGLINVSNLPSPNFLVIDEGFGSLDSENLSNMKGAFDYLKTRFESVFIISHLDTIKDFMDHLLPITIKKGYSNIVYS